MSEISLEEILNGVTLALHGEFPSARVYARTVVQNLAPGDFIVLPVTPQHSGQMGRRFKRGLRLDIIYHPMLSGCRDECLAVFERLADVVGAVTTANGDILHGSLSECSIEDDAMHCIVSYEHFAYSLSKTYSMEKIEMKLGGEHYGKDSQ